MSSDNFKATVDFYSSNAHKYNDWVGDYYSPEQVTSFISMLPKGGVVLDAGCGTGRDTNFMTEAGLQAVGLDAAEGMIQVACANHPNAEFMHGDFRKLEFQDNTFDGIWAHASLLNLETIEDVRQALSEFWRVIKPEGILHVLVKKQAGDHKVILSHDQDSGGKRIVHYFTEDEIKQLLNEIGFDPFIVEVYAENERNPQGRDNVTWIHTLSKKKSSPAQ